MSLVDEYKHPCRRLIKTATPDGEGGTNSTYRKGETIFCSITYDTSLEARKADKDGVNDNYLITTDKTVELVHGDVLQRISDNQIFLITTDWFENQTPASASINMRQVQAKRWELDGSISN